MQLQKTCVIQNEEVCPKCNQPTKHDIDTIISLGKQYHRSCFELKEKVPTTNTISYTEVCPKCGESVSKFTKNDLAPDVIISGGQQYHRKCFEIKEHVPKVLNITHDEICSKCNKPVSQKAGRNDQSADVIISLGKQYHRSCFDLPEPVGPQRIFKGVADVCPTCQQPVKDRNEAIFKLGEPYHRTCFFGENPN